MNSTENCHAAQQDFVSSSVLVSLSEAGGAPDRSEDLLALDEALAALEKIDSRTSRLVELRFVGGLAVNETAAVLGVSERTVHASGDLARAWLFRELNRRYSQNRTSS